mmetsp:Transcript_24461/g.27209  ORF Transcript_24461/g.27209 Transcript_24461/m.27209 type:complete len:145 (-) Transcript_24461:135-569(-)
MKYLICISLLLAVVCASLTRSYEQTPTASSTPPETPPLGMFYCNQTTATGCGYGTSCESRDDACNRAVKVALLQMVQFCSQLKTVGARLCLPDPGNGAGVAAPDCVKYTRESDNVYYCSDMTGWQCSTQCVGDCFELDAIMNFA